MREIASYFYRRGPKILRKSLNFYNNPLKSFAFLMRHFSLRKHTHTSIIDLLHLESFIIDLYKRKISGDIVECGSWKGGSAALMYKTAKRLGWKNRIYIYDSFEGFPEPEEATVDGEKAQGIKEGKFDWIKADEQDVVKIFKELNIYDTENVSIVKGWFNETTPQSPVEKIAILHCDGDLYESTKSTLDSFYHKVQSGGYVVSNDYGDIWIGAKKAMDECIAKNCPEVQITKIPGGGAYFVKP